MKSSPSAHQPNGRSVHKEKKREQLNGHAGACMGKCNKVHARKCEHNEYDVHVFALTQACTSRMSVCQQKRAEEGCQRARLGSSLNLCERMCICNHSLFECTCHIVRMRGNANVYMYKRVEVCKNIYVRKKSTSCRIKAGIYMCAAKNRTYICAWYGHACTAPCTCNVVCVCGKKHAQEGEVEIIISVIR